MGAAAVGTGRWNNVNWLEQINQQVSELKHNLNIVYTTGVPLMYVEDARCWS